jgi:hypothetical protein
MCSRFPPFANCAKDGAPTVVRDTSEIKAPGYNSLVSNEIVDWLRRLRWIAVPLVLLVMALGLSIYAFVIQASAKSILKDVYALRVGFSSVAELEQLAARHRVALRERHCNDQDTIAFEIYNTWLYRLELEPIAKFRVDVGAQEGTVNFIRIMLSRDTRVFPTMDSAGETAEYSKVPSHMRRNGSAPYWFPTPVGKPYLFVALTNQASATQREHAYAYSLDCLTKLGGGCDLPCDYLPLAWHDWQAELEKAGFGVGGFGPYYPNRNRCK